MSEEICCPRFDPTGWDDTVLEWTDKRFIKSRVFTLFYMPVNFGQVMRRLDNKIGAGGGKIPDNLCLSDHTSKWNMDVYVAVDKQIPGLNNVTLSGNFFSKIYEGPYQDTEKWWQDFTGVLKSKALEMKRSFMWYTTCPKCARKYGKNYVAIIVQTS